MKKEQGAGMQHYRRDIDGLRCLAVVPVVLFHAGLPFVTGGYVGVDVFFVISGYLITSILLREKQAGTYSIIGFYDRRARRILPALFVVLLATIPAAWLLMMPSELKLYGGGLTAVVTYISNLWFMFNTNYFTPAADENPLLHTWSLSVEEQFYLVFPLALSMCWLLGKRALFIIFLIATVASLALAHWSTPAAPTASFYVLPTRAWELLVGTIVAFASAERSIQEVLSIRARNAMSLVGLAMLLGPVFIFPSDLPAPSLFTAIPVTGTALLIYAGDNRETWVGTVLCLPPLVAIGLISYSLYLWHQPLFAFARLATTDEISIPQFAFLTLVAILLSVTTLYMVERPFRNKQWISQGAIFAVATGSTIGFLTVGATFYYGNGFSSRLDPLERAQVQMIDNEGAKRFALIQSGTCHYSSVGSIANFLKQWACYPRRPGAKRIFVVGDSHAADLSMILRSGGMDIGQLTSAGCTIRWRKMSKSCRTTFGILLKRLKLTSDDTLIIAQRWNNAEDFGTFTIDLDRWKSYGAEVVLAGPTPEFPNLVRRSLSAADEGGLAKLEEYDAENVFSNQTRQAFEHAAATAKVNILRLDDIFCNSDDIDKCSPVKGGRLKLLDNSHMTAYAAALMAPQVVRRLALLR